ncbi:MAG: 3-deoxy-D-manno-octulosonic acid transferase [Brevundimonas sp.]|nr:MAG: 3-deoxy-D-manno-octulosonic acid transferase [Brevundimonas sp.]
MASDLLQRRVRRGKEDPARVSERLGRASQPRPSGHLIWLHGVSVGESLSLLPLVQRFRQARPDLSLLVTSGTTTSAHLLAERLPAGVLHQYVPVDTPGAVAAFLDHWQPQVGILVESELWPNLILMAHERGVKLALVSARITEHSGRNWQRIPAAARTLLEAFDAILPQDEASASRITALGGRVTDLANLKQVGDPLPHDPTAFTRLSAMIGDRPVIVAGSTHPGEELPILRALMALQPTPLIVLIPRHPERSKEIASALADAGLTAAFRSEGAQPDLDETIYVADTLGEMGLFLRLADAVVLGGGFGPTLDQPALGGHNPLEPARLGKAVFSGRDMANWRTVAEELVAAGGLVLVEHPGDLTGRIQPLLNHPDRAHEMGKKAQRAAQTTGGDVLTRIWHAVEPLLPARQGGEP